VHKKILKDRSQMLLNIRAFFSKKNILEVDCPSLLKHPSIDTYIEVMKTEISKKKVFYLHTSPEFAMKKLLSKYNLDIFYLGHVFRKEEIGNLHSPEFTLIEWYRQNISYEKFLKELIDLINLFFKKKLPYKRSTYRKTFFKYTKIDYVKASKKTLFDFAKNHKKINLNISLKNLEKDDLLSIIISSLIEPHLGKDHLFALENYPASQAALAKTKILKDEKIAERFEIYYRGIELANGFHELTDPKEQRERFNKINKQREKKKKEKFSIDENFIKSLKNLKDCFGVAVGFDRLMMLRHKKNHIKDIIPFSIEEM
jgi:lysyl-tRNA synthetase class 2